jgi:hypothetical protein
MRPGTWNDEAHVVLFGEVRRGEHRAIGGVELKRKLRHRYARSRGSTARVMNCTSSLL